LVDDSEEFLASAVRLLESLGFVIVATASNSSDAMRKVIELTPDIAFVDIELGTEDGIALAEELQGLSSSLRVILISAYDRDDMRDLISDSAAIGFLPKSDLGADSIRTLLERA
jgi:DNA-binding NarL/FixJ family response regulator